MSNSLAATAAIVPGLQHAAFTQSGRSSMEKPAATYRTSVETTTASRCSSDSPAPRKGSEDSATSGTSVSSRLSAGMDKIKAKLRSSGSASSSSSPSAYHPSHYSVYQLAAEAKL